MPYRLITCPFTGTTNCPRISLKPGGSLSEAGMGSSGVLNSGPRTSESDKGIPEAMSGNGPVAGAPGIPADALPDNKRHDTVKRNSRFIFLTIRIIVFHDNRRNQCHPAVFGQQKYRENPNNKQSTGEVFSYDLSHCWISVFYNDISAVINKRLPMLNRDARRWDGPGAGAERLLPAFPK